MKKDFELPGDQVLEQGTTLLQYRRVRIHNHILHNDYGPHGFADYHGNSVINGGDDEYGYSSPGLGR